MFKHNKLYITIAMAHLRVGFDMEHMPMWVSQIRNFLAAMPNELPVMALETVQFERQSIADPEVQARLRLVLYLGRSS